MYLHQRAITKGTNISITVCIHLTRNTNLHPHIMLQKRPMLQKWQLKTQTWIILSSSEISNVNIATRQEISPTVASRNGKTKRTKVIMGRKLLVVPIPLDMKITSIIR